MIFRSATTPEDKDSTNPGHSTTIMDINTMLNRILRLSRSLVDAITLFWFVKTAISIRLVEVTMASLDTEMSKTSRCHVRFQILQIGQSRLLKSPIQTSLRIEPVTSRVLKIKNLDSSKVQTPELCNSELFRSLVDFITQLFCFAREITK